MENILTVPTNINENDYLPIAAVTSIWNVGARQIRNIAQLEEVQKKYYSSMQHSDLVCYSAVDVYRVSVIRRNEWPHKIEGIIEKKDTYESPVRGAKILAAHNERRKTEVKEEVAVHTQPPAQPVGGMSEYEQEILAELKKLIQILSKPNNGSTKRLIIQYAIPTTAFLVFIAFCLMKLQ